MAWPYRSCLFIMWITVWFHFRCCVLLYVCRPKEQSLRTPSLFCLTPTECICCSVMTVSIPSQVLAAVGFIRSIWYKRCSRSKNRCQWLAFVVWYLCYTPPCEVDVGYAGIASIRVSLSLSVICLGGIFEAVEHFATKLCMITHHEPEWHEKSLDCYCQSHSLGLDTKKVVCPVSSELLNLLWPMWYAAASSWASVVSLDCYLQGQSVSEDSKPS